MAGTSGDRAPPLVGRDQEQSLLRSVLDEVATRGQALVLRGEPGIGKSQPIALVVEGALIAIRERVVIDVERHLAVGWNLEIHTLTVIADAHGEAPRCRLPVERNLEATLLAVSEFPPLRCLAEDGHGHVDELLTGDRSRLCRYLASQSPASTRIGTPAG